MATPAVASGDDAQEVDPLDAAILRELSRGRTWREVATAVSLSERTVRRRTELFARRVGVSTTIEAVVYAVRSALI